MHVLTEFACCCLQTLRNIIDEVEPFDKLKIFDNLCMYYMQIIGLILGQSVTAVCMYYLFCVPFAMYCEGFVVLHVINLHCLQTCEYVNTGREHLTLEA